MEGNPDETFAAQPATQLADAVEEEEDWVLTVAVSLVACIIAAVFYRLFFGAPSGPSPSSRSPATSSSSGSGNVGARPTPNPPSQVSLPPLPVRNPSHSWEPTPPTPHPFSKFINFYSFLENLNRGLLINK